MQILYKKVTYEEEENILAGITLLNDYTISLKTEDAIVQAYNIGIGNYLKGRRNSAYLKQFKEKKKEILAYNDM